MQAYEKTHKCLRGDMELRPSLNSEMVEIIENSPTQKIKTDNAELMSLFCPRCSDRMYYDKGQELRCVCLNCGLDFPTRWFYLLIEFHPHKNEKGEWT